MSFYTNTIKVKHSFFLISSCMELTLCMHMLKYTAFVILQNKEEVLLSFCLGPGYELPHVCSHP